MPLRDYEALFNPDEVGRMMSAFDSAWQKLAASLGAAKSEKEIQTLRTKLAECIVISALDISDGPEDLADEALRCLHDSHLITTIFRSLRFRLAAAAANCVARRLAILPGPFS